MSDEHDHLDWLAFLYVSGEMAHDDVAAFEQRLESDQAARDAVAAAVDLSQTILAAESLLVASPAVISAPPARDWWMSPAAWFVCGAAACWLLVFAVNFSRTTTPQASVSEELVAAWSQRWDAAEPIGEEDGDAVSPSAEEPHETTLATDAPDWMMEAVRALHGSNADRPDEAPQELEGQS